MDKEKKKKLNAELWKYRRGAEGIKQLTLNSKYLNCTFPLKKELCKDFNCNECKIEKKHLNKKKR